MGDWMDSEFSPGSPRRHQLRIGAVMGYSSLGEDFPSMETLLLWRKRLCAAVLTGPGMGGEPGHVVSKRGGGTWLPRNSSWCCSPEVAGGSLT